PRGGAGGAGARAAPLANKGLIRGREGRGRMPPTTREYAAERLGAHADAAAVRRRHAEQYLALAEASEPEILGATQLDWLARLDRERDNFRAALDWTLEERAAETALRLIGALRRAWVAGGFPGGTRRWPGQALALGGDGAPAVLAKALYGEGRVALVQGDYDHAVPRLEESAARFRALGDARGLAFALADLGWI